MERSNFSRPPLSSHFSPLTPQTRPVTLNLCRYDIVVDGLARFDVEPYHDALASERGMLVEDKIAETVANERMAYRVDGLCDVRMMPHDDIHPRIGQLAGKHTL